jgi:hypothetical protein
MELEVVVSLMSTVVLIKTLDAHGVYVLFGEQG